LQFKFFTAFKADGSPRELDTPCEHSRYHDFLQNIVSADKQQEENDTTKANVVGNNNYTNIDSSTPNSIPIAPRSMSIPDCTSNDESAPIDSTQKANEHHGDANDTAEVCPDTVMKPSLVQSDVDEVDSVLVIRGQETAEMKYDQGQAPTNTTNVSKTTNEATENRMPEYMNLTANIGHDTVKVLGAIPKKLPAPPVPPRGMYI